MELPLYSTKELWRSLTNENIGFHTFKNHNSIPSKPGVYAWFLPLILQEEINRFISDRKLFDIYDVRYKDRFHREIHETFQWQNLILSLQATNNFNMENKKEITWRQVQEKLTPNQFKTLSQIFTLATIFTKPLYIGLTKNLNARYEEHLMSSTKNTFNKRFTEYQKMINKNISMKDLLFVSLPVDIGGVDDLNIDENIVEIFEYILKHIAGPIYGEK